MDQSIKNIPIDEVCIKECAKSIALLAPSKSSQEEIIRIFEVSELVWRDNYAPASSMVDWYVSTKPGVKAAAVDNIIEYFLKIAPETYYDKKDVYIETTAPAVEAKINIWFKV